MKSEEKKKRDKERYERTKRPKGSKKKDVADGGARAPSGQMVRLEERGCDRDWQIVLAESQPAYPQAVRRMDKETPGSESDSTSW